MTLQIDASTPAVATNASNIVKTVVTGTFTPADGSLLLPLWAGNATLNNNPGTPTIADSLTNSYTLLDWQSRADSPTVNGQAADWYTVIGTGSPMTVTVTSGTAASEFQSALGVQVITGQDPINPIGVHGKNGSGSTNTVSQSFTASVTGSWGFLVVTDWDSLGSMSAGSGCSLIATGTVPTTQISYGIFSRTSPDGVAGASTTLVANLAGTSSNVSWTYVEIVPPVPVQVQDEDPPPPFLPAYFTYQLAVLAQRFTQQTNDLLFPVNLISNGSPVVATTLGPAAATSPTFSPPAGGLIVVGVAANNATGAAPSVPTIADSIGLSWTLRQWQSRADSPTVDGQAAMFTAVATTGAPMTVSVTGHSDAANSQVAIKVWYTQVAGCTVGVSGKAGSAGASSINQSYTARANGGQLVAAVCDWTVQGPQTVPAATETGDGTANILTDITYGFLHRTLADDVGGQSNSWQTTLPASSNNLSWAWLEILPPTTNPPVVSSPRRRGGYPPRRARATTSVLTAQVVASAPAYPPAGVRQSLKRALARRPEAAQPVPPQSAPIVPALISLPTHAPVRAAYTGRHRSVAPVLSKQKLPPPVLRVRPKPALKRRPAQVAPPLGQDGVWQVLRARLKLPKLGRSRATVPVAAQASPTPPPVRIRLRFGKVWRGQAATPVPPQATVTPPPYPAQGLRPRIRSVRLFRGRPAAPTPPQAQAAAPGYVPGRVRQGQSPRLVAPRRVRPVAAVPPQQLVPLASRPRPRRVTVVRRRALSVAAPATQSLSPPLTVKLRRRLVRLFRGRAAAVVPAQVLIPPPPYPPQPVHVRRGSWALRRRRGALSGWQISQICSTPQPNTGLTTRPSTGTTAYALATTARPGSGITTRPNTGVTSDPC